MTSLHSNQDRPVADLTTRARIRDAALAQFAEYGFPGATLKGIAERAGVSVGLVQHHFGTKDNLRTACDEAVVDMFRRQTTQAAASGELTEPGYISELFNASPLLLRYLARAAVDGGPAAATVLDELSAGAEDFLTQTWPERFAPNSTRARDAAAVMCAMHTGVIVMREHLARQMHADLDGADNTRISLAMLDLYAAMGEFATSETGRQMRTVLTDYRDASTKNNTEDAT